MVISLNYNLNLDDKYEQELIKTLNSNDQYIISYRFKDINDTNKFLLKYKKKCNNKISQSNFKYKYSLLKTC
jgi:hypothetical protein